MSHQSKCTRRAMLKTAGTTAFGTVAGRILSPAALLYGRDCLAQDAPAGVDVGIARGSNMEDAVRSAVSLAGGVDFIQPGQTVLIKPNVTGALKHPTTTNPEVIYAVIKLVAERGPRRILVSDRSFSATWNELSPKTIDVMKSVGHVDAVNQAIADCKAPVIAVGFEDAATEFKDLGITDDRPAWRRIKHPRATHWPDGFELAELLFAVDHVINVPVIKTHFQAWFTMSLKAFVGMSHHRSRREFHSSFKGENSLFAQKRPGSRRRGSRTREQDVEEAAPLVNRVAELNLGIQPALNILDGTRSFVFGGPSHGDSVDPKLIVASRDRVAADATGIAVLKHFGTEDRLQRFSVWETPFLQHAIRIGLGIDGVGKLNLKQSGLDAEIESIRKMLA